MLTAGISSVSSVSVEHIHAGDVLKRPVKSSCKVWQIVALGLTPDELKLLAIFSRLTVSRSEGSYRLCEDIHAADILIVNADDFASMAKWHNLAKLPNPPVMVLYTDTTPTDPSQHYILRPFGPSKLLALLDRISVKLTEAARLASEDEDEDEDGEPYHAHTHPHISAEQPHGTPVQQAGITPGTAAVTPGSPAQRMTAFASQAAAQATGATVSGTTEHNTTANHAPGSTATPQAAPSTPRVSALAARANAAAVAAGIPAAQIRAPEARNAAPVKQMRVLIIDDSLTVLKQLSLELQKFRILSDCAENGEEGLNMLSHTHYDLIFLDIVLPGTDGYMICKCIRKNPKTRLTPVIMLTSKSSLFDRVRGKLVGCDEYLTKPVDYKEFRVALEKHLNIE